MELRHTETNSGDDSRGRAFGLDGNLYLFVVIAVVLSLGIGAVLGVLLQVGWIVAGVAAALPLIGTVLWAVGLKHGKPAGYDRDWVEQKFGGGDFTREQSAQRGLLEP